jgi:hypothetical protein
LERRIRKAGSFLVLRGSEKSAGSSPSVSAVHRPSTGAGPKGVMLSIQAIHPPVLFAGHAQQVLKVFEREASSAAAERWHLVCATPLFGAGADDSGRSVCLLTSIHVPPIQLLACIVFILLLACCPRSLTTVVRRYPLHVPPSTKADKELRVCLFEIVDTAEVCCGFVQLFLSDLELGETTKLGTSLSP